MSMLTNIGELLATLVLVGFLTETTVEILKQFVLKTKWEAQALYVLSIVVGILLCVALDVSLFAGSMLAHYVGIIICGLVASRGANYVHNFLGNLPKKQ